MARFGKIRVLAVVMAAIQVAMIMAVVVATAAMVVVAKKLTGMPDWAARQLSGILAVFFGWYTVALVMSPRIHRQKFFVMGMLGRILWRIKGRPGQDARHEISRAGIGDGKSWICWGGWRISPIFSNPDLADIWGQKNVPKYPWHPSGVYERVARWNPDGTNFFE